jgi:3-deoxy-D-manno-octulosonate 8-phosphate phosphatase (KDO 8-P phosphatase)
MARESIRWCRLGAMPVRGLKLFVMDVDGTLTDGRLHLDDNGVQSKTFHVRDGLAIKHLQQCGIATAIITGRSSDVVAIRAAELGITEVHQGSADKLATLREMCERLAVGPSEVAYIGDDLNDLPVIRQVGYAIAVGDARDEVKEFSHFVTTAPGGGGAVCEAAEHILRSQGKWDQVLSGYL